MTMALMTAIAVLTVMTGTYGQPTVNGPTVAATSQPPIGTDNFVNPTTTTTTAYRPFNESSAYGLKKVMWKRCMSKNYVTCVKLALVHLVDRLERTNESYSLVPGVTVSSQKFADTSVDDAVPIPPPATAGRGDSSSEAFDRYFVEKLGRYFGTLTLNVKMLDDATVQSVRNFGIVAADASVESGRGKKQKYAQSILLAGWVTGAMLLALGMKTIAVLAGKALMTALMSLLLSALASFRAGGGHHAEPKSTTYEIVTKPVYTHSHATGADDVHAAGTQNVPTYRRSIGGGGGTIQHLQPSSSEEVDHVVYRIHASDKTPIYIPIERRRR